MLGWHISFCLTDASLAAVSMLFFCGTLLFYACNLMRKEIITPLPRCMSLPSSLLLPPTYPASHKYDSGVIGTSYVEYRIGRVNHLENE